MSELGLDGAASDHDDQGQVADPETFSENRTSSPIVVGIGASAGGLEAIQELFDNLPGNTGASFVVVQHLSPDFKSLMDEILRRHTKMAVVKVDSEALLQPDSVYLLPPRTNIAVKGASLVVQPQLSDLHIQRPIDVFFDSLAAERAEACIAIVLSGTGSDGSRGLRNVKEAGGIVLVQEPATAEFDGMPTAAISTTYVDFVLPPAEIARKVAVLLDHPFLRERCALPAAGPLDEILSIVREEAGTDLTCYKPGTILRRIQRRMSLRHLREPGDYIELLRGDPDEVRQLARECFINVTRFFRDLQAFWSLRQHLVRTFVQEHERTEPFRVWVAGCATGEEAYSIAALIQLALNDVGARFDFKVFATDVDDEALEIASAASYPEPCEPDIPRAYFDRIVRRENGVLRVVPAVRNKIVFARHDVLRDPPFARTDLVVCRNLLIYFKPDAQRTVLARLHFALRRNSLLFLGPSETIEPLGKDFKVLDVKWRIYSKKSDSRLLLEIPQAVRRTPGSPQRTAEEPLRDNPIIRASEHLVSLFAAAGVIVNESGQVVYTFGDVSRWLTLPRGMVSTDLRLMLPEGSADSALVALRQARVINGPVRVANVRARHGEAPLEQSLDVVHVPGDNGRFGFDVLLLGRKGDEASNSLGAPDTKFDDVTRRQVEILEQELQGTRESLQTTIEELETTNEELQSVNEELLASNEELQSTNEELHSVNEELYTVNAEHQQKIAELARVTEDLENLLAATNIGTVFLDDDLHIRRFTPAAEIALPLREQDIGRSILELVTHLDDLDLCESVRSRIKSGESREMQARTKNGTPLLVGIHPFARGGGPANSAVVTFVDMSRVEERQRESLSHAQVIQEIAQASSDAFWVREVETLRARYLSPAYARIWGTAVAESVRDPIAWLNAVHRDDRERVEREFFGRATGPGFTIEYRIQRPDGQKVWIRDRVLGHARGDDGALVALGISEDITRRIEIDRLHRRNVEIHKLACDRARVPMILLRRNGEFIWANQAAIASLPGDGTEPVRDLRTVLATPEDARAWDQALRQFEIEGVVETKVIVKFGRPAAPDAALEVDIASVRSEEDDQGFLVCQWLDVSHQIARERELSSKLETFAAEAHSDALTELLNRRGLSRLWEQQVALAQRLGSSTMVLLVDCDNFKVINDTYSHAAGDQALRNVAAQLRASLRPTDLLARVGGDEFLAVLPDTRLAEGAHVAEKIRRAVAAAPINVQGSEIHLTVSIGVVPAPPGETSTEAMIMSAGAALKASKNRGRNRVCFLDHDGSWALDGPDSALQRLLGGEVRVVAQTINAVRTGAVIGYELFSRGPTELAAPNLFFEISRQNGCLEKLDLLCFERCLTRALEFEDAVRVHLNLFPSSLLAEDGRALDRCLSRIPAGRHRQICIELSEQQFIGDSTLFRSRIDIIRSQGIAVALDDVGFGHSSLETLLAVEPEIVKIDKRMVDLVDRSPSARRILDRFVRLMNSQKLTLIAEGVERESQRRVLSELGVTQAQGYLWSRPEPATAGVQAAED